MKLALVCLSAREDRESSFHNSGVTVNLMQACLSEAAFTTEEDV